MTKCFAEFRVRRRGKIEVVNRRDRRVAIYSSRSARVAAAKGGKARSGVRFSQKRGRASFLKLLLLVFKQPLEARGETGEALNLARDDDLRRLTVGGLFERFERLDLDDLIVGVGLVEHLDGVGERLLHVQDGLRFTLGLEDGGLTLGLGLEDGRLLFGVRAQDGGLLFALGHEDLGLLLALGLQD